MRSRVWRSTKPPFKKGMTLLFESHDKMGQNVHTAYSAINKCTDMLRLVSYKSIDIEARSRRNNLIFRNVPYTRNDNCFDLVREFLTSQLDLDGNDVYIERAHVFGPYNRRNSTRRDIIACFRDYPDTNTIMGKVGNLRNTPYFVDRDYPQRDSRCPKTLMGQV